VLSLGCVWGAINLLAIGLNRNFSTISYSWILAHGHAMVFGFVGFFIMGFAYQVFPRFKQTHLWRPGLAFASLPLMVAGIALQTVAHLIVPANASSAAGTLRRHAATRIRNQSSGWQSSRPRGR
jgi:heme/copper-type cytochrome/quinol oxidase subunit 1